MQSEHGVMSQSVAHQNVYVVYADALRVLRGAVVWHDGLTATEAIAAVAEISALGAALELCGLAVWGLRVPPEYLLQPGDRLEILPPLPNDPKDSRRQRVVEARGRSRAQASAKAPPKQRG